MSPSSEQQCATTGSNHLPIALMACSRHHTAGIAREASTVPGWDAGMLGFFNFYVTEETAGIPSQIHHWHHPSHMARGFQDQIWLQGLIVIRNVSLHWENQLRSGLFWCRAVQAAAHSCPQPGEAKGQEGEERAVQAGKSCASCRAICNNRS